jgi:hypothetical protein
MFASTRGEVGATKFDRIRAADTSALSRPQEMCPALQSGTTYFGSRYRSRQGGGCGMLGGISHAAKAGVVGLETL